MKNIDSVLKQGTKALAAALFDLICVLCFIYAARMMYEDVYNAGRMDSDFITAVVIMVLSVSLLHELSDNYGRIVRVLTVLGTAVGGMWWLYDNYFRRGISKVASGFYRIATLYVEDWNEYYGTSFYLFDEGSFSHVSKSLDVTMLVLFFILLHVAKCSRKNRVLSLVPNVLLAAMLITGRVPQVTGIFLMFAGILLVRSNGFKKPDFRREEGSRETVWSWMHMFIALRTAVVIAAVFMILSVTQTELAENTVNTHSESVKRATAITVDNTIKKLSRLEAVKEIELSGALGEMVNSYAADVDTGIEKLSNSAPVYKYEPALEIALNKKPLANMYLKSFCAANYEDGVWTRDDESFENACLEAGLDASQMSENIVTLTINKMKRIKKVGKLSDISIGNYGSITDLTYTTAVSLPYAAEPGEDQPLKLKGDAWYGKEATTKTVLVELWNYSGVMDELSYLSQISEEDWEAWYEDYVKANYLSVPEGMPQIEALAEELLGEMGDYEDHDISIIVNKKRLDKVALVKAWLRKNTSYSLTLEELPQGEDPVEYFIGTSREGYCMHYASAATLLLRKMGVPARYASGYIAEASSFKAMYTGYKSIVPDSNAHAWVEIYLDGIGWIHVEVTNSITGDSQDNPVTEAPTETTTIEPETEPDLPEEPTDSSETEPINPDEGEDIPESGEKDETDKTDKDDAKEGIKLWQQLLMIAGIFIVILAAAYIVLKIPAVRRYILKRELIYLETLEPQTAICEINRRLYTRLKVGGKLPGGNVGDKEFADILKKQFTDAEDGLIERYMELVKEATFSKKSMTKEEMMFCYEVYCRIGRNGLRH